MNKFIRSVFFLLVPLFTVYGQEATGTSTVTFGLGAGRPIQNNFAVSGGPQLNGHFEYRLRKHWAFEFGVDNTLVTVPKTTVTYTIFPGTTVGVYSNSTYTYNYSLRHSFASSMPFGLKGILPLNQGRLELFAGAGGTYLWNPDSYGDGSGSGRGGFGWQATLGGRMAIDKQRRFWLGTSGRFTGVSSANPTQWVTWSADLGFRFGR